MSEEFLQDVIKEVMTNTRETDRQTISAISELKDAVVKLMNRVGTSPNDIIKLLQDYDKISKETTIEVSKLLPILNSINLRLDKLESRNEKFDREFGEKIKPSLTILIPEIAKSLNTLPKFYWIIGVAFAIVLGLLGVIKFMGDVGVNVIPN